MASTDNNIVRKDSAGADVERVSLDKPVNASDRVDKELAQYTSDIRINISPERSKELKKKIDKRVLSIMITTYFLQAIDKGTLSFASIMGFLKDNGLATPTGKANHLYPWLTTCIYIAILIVEYPQNYIITRVPIAKYLSFSIIAWGIVLGCHAACSNFTQLVVVRTLLGIFESACQPAFVILSSMWYRREEQAASVTYWYMMNGAQQIVGGLLAYCFSLIPAGGVLKSWQWLFLAYGIISVIYGIGVGYWMPDSPMRAKCWTEQEKHEMVERVRDNQTGMQNRKWKMDQAIEGIKDPQTWGYALIALTTTLPTSGLGAFFNLIVKDFGFSTIETQLLAMVLGFYIIFVLLTSAWLVKKTNQNLLVMLCFCLPSFAGTAVLMAVPNNSLAQKIGLLISYYITLSFWSAQTLNLSMISRNVAGQTKKSVVVATNFIVWAAGNAIGPQVFLERDAPRYFIAFATHLGCYVVLVGAIIFLRFYLRSQNKKRDKLAADGVAEARDENMTRAWDDLTDKENLNFRYVY
ncbi:unnamed protein product [Clonostachys rhizophaga]|uniref:Major facilitator superfamily (MFS) profile domain-containing protein n=1 Tax=Clonostachys rhizophaga TaxID=160324 RepID=A0A9N9VA62_9HYPO|nr:unnamed protein product [Clonostachys rhizophaga]